MVSWVFFGRILPERVPVTVTPPKTSARVDAIALAFEFQIRIHESRLVVELFITEGNTDIDTLRNLVAQQVRTITDIIGFQYGGKFDVDVDFAVSQDEGGAGRFFSNTIPALVNLREKDMLAIAHERLSAIMHDNAAQFALADFREAMGNPLGTGFFCYRAIEAMMQSMKPDLGNYKDAPYWRKLKSELRIDSSTLWYLKSHADLPRHGKPNSITDEERQTVFELTHKIINRYLAYLTSGKSPLSPDAYPVLYRQDHPISSSGENADSAPDSKRDIDAAASCPSGYH
jgi:hypothetical protein